MKRTLEPGSCSSLPKKVVSIFNEGDLTNSKEVELAGVRCEGRAFNSTGRPQDFEGNLVARKKGVEVVPPFQCMTCRSKPTTYNVVYISRHQAGEKHRRLQELVDQKEILESWGIHLVDNDEIKYMCTVCDLQLESSFKKMEQHFNSVHKPPPPTLESPIVEVTKVYRRKKFFETGYDFDQDKANFLLVNGLVSIQESTGLSKSSIGLLKRDLIPKSDIRELYGMASILEQLGRPVKRSKKISGSRMVMYGLHERYQLGWFVQAYPELYALSEKFVKKMARYFEVAIPEVMTNFEQILTTEGLDTTEGHFGGTPLTSFAITRDYSCLPHNDPRDYGFGIIVWLHPDGEVEVEEQPQFWLPEYKLHFHCGNGAAFVCDASTIMHCTTSPKPVGILGMAFVQFRPFIVQLSKALKNPTGSHAKTYFEARERYINERDGNRGKGVAAIFY